MAIKLGSGEVRGIPVSMGNPHLSCFVEEFPPDGRREAAEIGQSRPDFKHGINVEFVSTRDRSKIESDFSSGAWEKPSHPEPVPARRRWLPLRQASSSPVRVHAPGGIQTVRWEGQVYLRGRPQLICRGEFFV